MKNLQKTIELLYSSTPESIVSVGYGRKQINGKLTNQKAIVYGVVQKKPLEELDPSEIIPKHININGELVLTDVIETKGQFNKLSNCFAASDSSSNSHRILTRPLLGGISIGTEHPDSTAGTLGGIVKDNENGFCCILSNNHVLVHDGIINSSKDNSKDAYSIQYQRAIQPGQADGGNSNTYVGYSKRYYPLDPSSTNNYVDAALSSINKITINNTSFKFLGLDNTKALLFATTAEIDSLIDNDISLFKSARTTGFTGGDDCQIKTSYLNFSISVGGYVLQDSFTSIDFADTIIFNYQDTTIGGYPRENVVVSGDSGSFLIGEFNGVKKIVGLIFAAGSFDGIVPFNRGIACRIDRVSELLNISPWNGINTKSDNINSWTYVQTLGLSNIINYIHEDKSYWQIGTVSGVDGLDSLYISSSNDLLKMCLLADSCTGKAPECIIPTEPPLPPPPTPTPTPPPPTPSPTPSPTPTPPPPEKANFHNDADWNDQDGNVTSVGTNGKSSYYSTYDQNGNVWEFTDTSDGANKICLGGAWDSTPSDLDKCERNNLLPESKNNNTGLRLVRLIDGGDVTPYTIYAHSCGLGPIHVLDARNLFNIIETKRFTKNSIYTRSGCTKTPTSNSLGKANGRALFVYNNTLFFTFVKDSKIYKVDLTTGDDLGYIQTSIPSMSTIAYDGTYYYCTDYSGLPYVYVIDPTTGDIVRSIEMQIPPTIPTRNYDGWCMDGLEYFDGKLIMNRGDMHPVYDVYDLNGNILIPKFIDARPYLESSPDSSIVDPAGTMGIAYDGTNFLVSSYLVNKEHEIRILIFSGNDGSFIGQSFVTEIDDICGSEFRDRLYGIEDLSIDYDSRPDIGEGFFTEWAFVGDSGNLPDNCNLGDDLSLEIGDVNYNFRIQRYQLTNSEYTDFLNSVAKTDSYMLYDINMDLDPRGGITRSGSSGSYVYSVKSDMEHKPVIYVNWFSGARLANWLHNRIDDESSIETETGAYTLNGATTGIIPPNLNARFRLPTIDEWHKAAYYKGGETNSYWNYAMQTDDPPCSVSATSTGDGSSCAN